MKIWRSGSQFVVERGDTYLVIDATGAITKRFAPSTWSIEDELGEIHFTVDGNRLREHTKIEVWGRSTIDEHKDELDDLVADPSAETLRFVETTLGDAAVVREEQRLREECAADARIAAIPGAREDHRMGEPFARAQAALVHRVRAYSDDICAALLRVLVELGRANAPTDAVHEFVRGCLLAAFATPVPDPVTAEPVPVPALAALVTPLVRQLEELADYKEFMDAMGAAGAYWAAARAIREAARLLGA